jgi:hypothetical protein
MLLGMSARDFQRGLSKGWGIHPECGWPYLIDYWLGWNKSGKGESQHSADILSLCFLATVM